MTKTKEFFVPVLFSYTKSDIKSCISKVCKIETEDGVIVVVQAFKPENYSSLYGLIPGILVNPKDELEEGTTVEVKPLSGRQRKKHRSLISKEISGNLNFWEEE